MSTTYEDRSLYAYNLEEEVLASKPKVKTQEGDQSICREASSRSEEWNTDADDSECNVCVGALCP